MQRFFDNLLDVIGERLLIADALQLLPHQLLPNGVS